MREPTWWPHCYSLSLSSSLCAQPSWWAFTSDTLGGWEENASARKNKQWRRRRNRELVNSKNNSASVYKASTRRNVGHDVAREAEAASPLTGGKFGKLLRCPCAMVSVQSNHHRKWLHQWRHKYRVRLTKL
jgi:hypothetical protein